MKHCTEGCNTFFHNRLKTHDITEKETEKDTQKLELVKATVCGIFCLFLQIIFIKIISSSQALANFDLKLSKDTAFSTS